MLDNPDVLEQVKLLFNDAIPFNRLLGVRLLEIARGRAVVEIPFRPEFVGDVRKGIVHGGVLSTLVDVTGGATAFSVLDYPREVSLNTVDMRVDFVRMGRGARFVATGSVLRKGNRICVTRIEVADDEGTLVAHGMAAYNIFSSESKASGGGT